MILRYHHQLSTNNFSRRKNRLFSPIVKGKMKENHQFVYYFQIFVIAKNLQNRKRLKNLLSRHYMTYMIGLQRFIR